MLTEVPEKFELWQLSLHLEEVDLSAGFVVRINYENNAYDFTLYHFGVLLFEGSCSEYAKEDVVNDVNNKVMRKFLELILIENNKLNKKVSKLESDLDSLKNS